MTNDARNMNEHEHESPPSKHGNATMNSMNSSLKSQGILKHQKIHCSNLVPEFLHELQPQYPKSMKVRI